MIIKVLRTANAKQHQNNYIENSNIYFQNESTEMLQLKFYQQQRKKSPLSD